MFTTNEQADLINRCLQIYAKQPKLINKIGDCWARGPSTHPELDETTYHTPVSLLNFYSNYTLDQLADFQQHCNAVNLSYRINGCMYYPDPAVMANTALDYHLIELKNWPKLKVLSKFKNNQNNFNRLQKQVVEQIALLVRPATKSEVYAVLAGMFDVQEPGVIDTLYVWLTSERFEQLQWLTVESTTQLSHHLTAVEQKTMWSFLITVVNGSASVGTWHLIDYAKNLGVEYFDMWNVAVTKRENYKKIFFTKDSFMPVHYHGAPINYAWMHTGEQAIRMLAKRW